MKRRFCLSGLCWDFPGGSVGKEPACNAGDIGVAGLIPRSGKAPGGGHGNRLQYSCLENPMDRGAQWAMVHGVTESWAWLRQLSKHTCRLTLLVSRLSCSVLFDSVTSHRRSQRRVASSRASARPRDQTCVSCVSCTGRQILYHRATWEADIIKSST